MTMREKAPSVRLVARNHRAASGAFRKENAGGRPDRSRRTEPAGEALGNQAYGDGSAPWGTPALKDGCLRFLSSCPLPSLVDEQ